MTEGQSETTGPAPEGAPKKRSGGLTALGVLNIVYGAFGICISLLAIVPTLLAVILSSQMPQDATSTALTVVGSIINILVAVSYIVAGIGLLRVIGWGRMLSLWVAGLDIFWTLLAFLLNMIFVFPSMPEMSEEMAGAEVIGGAVAGGACTVCMLIYPVIVVVLLNTESMKKQFPPPQSPNLGQRGMG